MALTVFNEDNSSDEGERRTALEVLDGLILKHQAKRMMHRNNPATEIVDTAKTAQGSN